MKRDCVMRLGSVVVLLLAIGAIANLAVAWACLLFEGAHDTCVPYEPFGITRDYGGILMVGTPMRSFHWPEYYDHLPDSLIWPGIAVNTIFFAVIFGLLSFVAVRARRSFVIRERIERGRCPACGYSIAPGVGSACSECGAALPGALRH